MELLIIYVILGIILGIMGVYTAQAFKPSKTKVKKVKEMEDDESEWEDEPDSSEDDEKQTIADEVLTEKYPAEDIKMVFIVREDLKMGKGKIGAQCGHACLGVYETVKRMTKKSGFWKKIMERWAW